MKQLNTEELRNQIQIPEEQRGMLERLLLAGKKVLYSQEMKDDFDEHFAEEGDMGQKIAEAVFTAVGIVFAESKGNLSPAILVPLGVNLVTDLSDFVEESGIGDVTDADIATAIEQYLGLMFNLFDQAGAEILQEKQGGSPEQMGQQPAQPPAQQGGLIGQNMNQPM